MKNWIQLLIIITLLLFGNELVTAQGNVEIKKKKFKIEGKKEGFRDAWKRIGVGDQAYEEAIGEGLYGAFDYALNHYIEANRYNPNNAGLNYKIGVCYLYTDKIDQAIKYLQRAYELRNDVSPDILYMLGKVHHTHYMFNKAISYYELFRKGIAINSLGNDIKDVNKRISECEYGKISTQKPLRIFIDNIGRNINSKYPEYSPLITADETMMFFTSRREGTTGGEVSPDDMQYYEDIYVSYCVDDIWQTAINPGAPLNTSHNDATVGMSADGQKLLIYDGKKRGGDILMCEISGEKWTKPERLDKNVNTKKHEESASISPDGQTLYFISNREDNNFGQHDIYKSMLDEDGEWGEAENLGAVVNTEYDERGIFIHPDGVTIYFSSQGHTSIGGYDIFKSTMDSKGNWTKPVNIGYPINTTQDDRDFVISADGKHGYYASAKKGGFGSSDIYIVTFLGPEKPTFRSNEDNLIASIINPVGEVQIEKTVELKTIKLTILKGTVRDAMSKKPLEASIEIIDNDANKVIFMKNSNSGTGKYLLTLPSGKNYGIAVKKKNYLFHSENFDIPSSKGYQEITKDIDLLNIKKGSKVVLKNIFFDTDKDRLRPESTNELERLRKMLVEYEGLKIEISGHTDNQGNQAYNQKLSESRAKAVVQYLIDNGIDVNRLQYKGYAFAQPIATNDTDEGRQLNRRVEFKVISYE